MRMSNEHQPRRTNFNIPSIEQVEEARKQKRGTLFFKPKRYEKSTATTSSSVAQPTSQTEPRSATPTTTTNVESSFTLTTSSSVTQPTSNTEPSASTSSSIAAEKPRAESITTSSTARFSSAQPPRRTVGNAILVNPVQQGNPLLGFIHNVPWEPDDSIRPDYVVGQTTGVLYLSLRYHRLKPEYIYGRMSKLSKLYVLRVLLVYVDIENYHDALRELNRAAILNNFTMMLIWSNQEGARYLETYKAFENKPPDLIRGEKQEDNFVDTMTSCLTHVRSVNKTDVLTLLSTFGSLKNIVNASSEQLSMCPGFGEQKVKRLQQAFTQPFIVKKKQRH